MKYLRITILLLMMPVALFSQQTGTVSRSELFREGNEVYFSFSIPDQSVLNDLTRVVSIDDVKGTKVYAYANRGQFERFLSLGYPYEILTPPGKLLDPGEFLHGAIQKSETGLTIWNFYPTYDEYITFMNGFASEHPGICKLINFGTTVQGRQLLAVKISDSVNEKQGEAEVFLTSSMHGDETTGYVLMLHLIDYLLTGYGNDPAITDMVDHLEIYINPLANPDGTYHGGNGSVYGAQRYNANGVDLNRNYPDPKGGPHPDGNDWQPETIAFMAFADSTEFVMSMNFHGGAEVFNYPWDTWYYPRIHADDAWWQFVGREYADTVHLYGPNGYFNDLDNGVTRGSDWYSIEGGRQDYTTYFKHGREVTLEISNTKILPASQLLNYWNYNYRSFLNYIEEASFGINGQVTDSVTGQPLNAKVFIFGHDLDNSFIYSKLPSGWYFRPIDEGSWDVSFMADEYFPRTIAGINVTRWNTTRVNVKLVPLNIGGTGNQGPIATFLVYPNPSTGTVHLILPDDRQGKYELRIFNTEGICCLAGTMDVIPGKVNTLNMGSLAKGIYHISLTSGMEHLNSRVVIR
jgi:hypothetical protein